MTTAAVAAMPPAGSPTTPKKPRPLMGPVRANLEAFGVAILAAVLLKWFCIEAFQIPTSSMQPTLMGDSVAGVYDRILVDKILPLFREPKRWDITVFKYPLQKNQNYVKRIGGMPGDRLRIAGGNLYQVIGEGGNVTYRIERKPDDLQEEMWKNVFPGRALASAQQKWLGQTLASSPRDATTEDAGSLTMTLDKSSCLLYFRDQEDGRGDWGVLDRVWDGYPEAVAHQIREKNQYDQPQEIVPDLRSAATLPPEQVVDELVFEVVVARPGHDTWKFGLVMKGGKAQLVVRDKDNKVLPNGSSAEFDLALPAGTATEVAFAHVDDRMIAWVGGRELQRFDCDAFACRDGCVIAFTAPTVNARGELQTQGKLDKKDAQRVTPQITARGKGKLRLDDLRIDRDQHYTRSTAPEIIEVPEGEYYMLGDNTLQSIDSRGWTAVTIGVDAQNNVVPPNTPGARVVRGNMRAMRLEDPPDRDETPFPIPSENVLVMIDEFGEVLRLNARIGPGWGQFENGTKRISFVPFGDVGGEREWVAPQTTNVRGISFVPRADIQGRAVLVFYPSRPFAWLFGNSWPDRFGFVR